MHNNKQRLFLAKYAKKLCFFGNNGQNKNTVFEKEYSINQSKTVKLRKNLNWKSFSTYAAVYTNFKVKVIDEQPKELIGTNKTRNLPRKYPRWI